MIGGNKMAKIFIEGKTIDEWMDKGISNIPLSIITQICEAEGCNFEGVGNGDVRIVRREEL